MENKIKSSSLIKKIGGLLFSENDVYFSPEDAYQLLVNQLFARTNPKSPLRTLLFTGATQQTGVTTITMGFARFLSQRLNQKTLVIDANYYNHGMSLLFQSRSGPGFSELLCGQANLEEVMHKTDDNLFLIPAGKRQFLSKTLLSFNPTDHEVLKMLASEFDITVIDGAPVSKSPEIYTLSAMVNGTILIAEAEKTRREVLRASKEQLEFAGANLIGGILNRRRFNIPAWAYSRIS